MLSFDSLAFHQSWSDLMHIKDGSKVATFPKAPLGWQNRYQKMSGLLHSDHSAIGISILHKLAQEHDLDSTLGVPLRDGREFHLRASSGLAAKAYRILDPNYCCTQTDLSTCAEDTFNQFKSAGGRLILPIVRQHHNRIPHQSSNFTNALIRMAQTEDDWMLVAPWWGYLDVEGDGMSPLPCQRPVRDGKGRKK